MRLLSERTNLADIKSVKIDPSLTAAKRAEQYLEQIKDPTCFLCDGVVVRVRFDPDGGELRDRLKNYFIGCKQA